MGAAVLMSRPSQPRPLRILFVCVGNSCRSQMAEALARDLAGSQVAAYSAGSSPLGRIVAPTYDVMAEIGIGLDGQWSKGLADVPAANADVTVTMGCEVFCPVPAGYRGKIVEWNIPDPYLSGLESYRAVRDQIEHELRELFKAHNIIPAAATRSGPPPAPGEDWGAT